VTRKQIAVVGGGVAGVCTAFFLAEAGHEVVVVERHQNVAQAASFASAGLVAPGAAGPWAAPGMPKKLMAFLLRPESPVLLKPSLDPALWRWLRRWMDECELDRYRVNRLRMLRLATYSQAVLQDLRERFQLGYERSEGILQLFRTEQDLRMAEPARTLLTEQGFAHNLLDADAARAIEPALGYRTELAGALHFPGDEAGNCPLFTKQLRRICESAGVHFHFTSVVRAIEDQGNRVCLHIDDRSFPADAVVVAAGLDSAALLKPLKIRLPVYPVKAYAATIAIKNFDEAPRAALIDETYKVSLTRLGERIRIAGMAGLGMDAAGLHHTAQRTLTRVASDWFPNAAHYHKSIFWSGAQPALPDGPPVIGATSRRPVYVNFGHGGHCGWTMAAGSGKIIADLLSGKPPEIDLDGLTVSRFG
jgi:D-amino-acid dehydrogenase